MFDRIAEAYGRKDLLPASRAARRQRLLRTLDLLPGRELGDVLEAGCGAGYAAEYLRGRYRSFTGIDYSEKLVRLAAEQFDAPNVRFEAANIKSFSAQTPFDVVFMIGVIHHIDDPASAMDALVRLVKPGGWLAANEPQPGNPVVHGMRIVRKRTDEHYSDEQLEIPMSSLQDLFVAAGLEDVRARPQGVFSTPFAEVILNPQGLTTPLSRISCRADVLVESLPSALTRYICWNTAIVGRRPGGVS